MTLAAIVAPAIEPLSLGKIGHARPFRSRFPRHRHHTRSSSAASPAVDTTPESDRYDLSLRLEGGYELGRVDGDATGGTRVGVGLGAQNDEGGWWTTLRGRFSSPTVGVHLWDFRFGVDADVLREGIFHVGVGLELGAMAHDARPGSRVQAALTLGLAGRAGIDLVRFGHRGRSALTIDVRLDMHVLTSPGSYGSLGLLAGVRF